MRPTVFLSASLLVISHSAIATENAQPDAQYTQRARPFTSFAVSSAQARSSVPLGHWNRQGTLIDTQSQSVSVKTTSTTSEAASSAVETPSSTTETSTTSSSPPTTTSISSSPPTSRSTLSSPSLTGVLSTASNGGITTIFQTVTNTGTATSASASASSTNTGDASSGVGGKSIAGIVVAGSLAVIGIAAFIWWKLSKKRFSGLDDTDDNFKWPDLNENTAMQPLPGRAESVHGGRDGAVDSSQSESTHAKPYYDNQSAMSSAADLSRAPVEHAQSAAYYDNPPHYPNYQQSTYGPTSDSASGYYDPYSGPVPEAFSPQTATGPSFATGTGRRSPGPNTAYDQGNYGPRAASPGPNAAYAPRSASPGPNVAYGGPRAASPGPNIAYGGPRSASPGPNAAYGPRSASPGPNAAYAAYGARSASPGPNYGYGGRISPGPNSLGQH